MVAELGNEQVRRCSHNRNVHFPADDALLISGYHEAPSNAFHLHQSHTVAVITDAYRKACGRQQISPNESVERQIACFHQVNGLRQECLSLKGQRLSQAHMECLEEILKRVQFDTLDFEYTFIDDDAAVSLAEMLEFYDSTVKLNLSFNKQINIRGWQAIFRAIKNCPSLQVLNLRYTSLSDRVVPVLTGTLKTQPSLTVLHIENVSLSGKSLSLLVSALKINTILRELYLGENNLQPADGIHLNQLIIGNSSIQMLDLRNNQLQDTGAAHIFDALKNSQALENSALSALVLWNNRLTSASMGALARGLMENDRLETLNIGSNNLSVDGVTALKPALLANTSLQRLGLQATGLDCQCAIVLAECIADNKVLVRVDLRDNAKIGSAGLLALHLAMKMNTSITLLDLDYSCTNPKVKEYDEEFRKYFNEIKEFCERNKKSALDKLTVQSEVPKDATEALGERTEDAQLDEGDSEKKTVPEVKVSGEGSDEKSEKAEDDKPVPTKPSGFGGSSTPRRRPVFKLTRSSSLTCAEMVEDLSERIVQMSRSLSALDESSLDAGPVVAKHNLNVEPSTSSTSSAPKELVKSPSLPILVNMNTNTDSAPTVKRKQRRFSVSVVPISASNPDIYRSSSPRFKVERVVLPSVKVPPQPIDTLSLALSNKSLGDGKSGNMVNSVAGAESDTKVETGRSESGSALQRANEDVVSGQKSDTEVNDKAVFVETGSKKQDTAEEPVVPELASQKIKMGPCSEKGGMGLDSRECCSLSDCTTERKKLGFETGSNKPGVETFGVGDAGKGLNNVSEIDSVLIKKTGTVSKPEVSFGTLADEYEHKKLAIMDLPSTSDLRLSSCTQADSRTSHSVTGISCKMSEFDDHSELKAYHGGDAISYEHLSAAGVKTIPATSVVDTDKKLLEDGVIHSTGEALDSLPIEKGTLHKCFKKECMPSTSKVGEAESADEEVIQGIVKDLVNYTVYEAERDEFVRDFATVPARSGHGIVGTSSASFGTSTRYSLKPSTAAYKDEEEKEAVRGVIRRLVREVLSKEKELVQDTLRRKRERIQMGITRELT